MDAPALHCCPLDFFPSGGLDNDAHLGDKLVADGGGEAQVLGHEAERLPHGEALDTDSNVLLDGNGRVEHGVLLGQRVQAQARAVAFAGKGAEMHCHVMKLGCVPDGCIGMWYMLVSMYDKFRHLGEERKALNEMAECTCRAKCDAISCTSCILNYSWIILCGL